MAPVQRGSTSFIGVFGWAGRLAQSKPWNELIVGSSRGPLVDNDSTETLLRKSRMLPASRPVFSIRIVEDETKRTFEFEPHAVTPLSLDDLVAFEATDRRSLSLVFEASGASVDGVPVHGHMQVRSTINFHEALRVYSLIKGGWLPPPLVVPPMYLVDRNVIATLRRLKAGGERRDDTELRWWLDLLMGRVWFNPLPAAMEADQKRTPTFDEFVASFEDAARELAI